MGSQTEVRVTESMNEYMEKEGTVQTLDGQNIGTFYMQPNKPKAFWITACLHLTESGIVYECPISPDDIFHWPTLRRTLIDLFGQAHLSIRKWLEDSVAERK